MMSVTFKRSEILEVHYTKPKERERLTDNDIPGTSDVDVEYEHSQICTYEKNVIRGVQNPNQSITVEENVSVASVIHSSTVLLTNELVQMNNVQDKTYEVHTLVEKDIRKHRRSSRGKNTKYKYTSNEHKTTVCQRSKLDNVSELKETDNSKYQTKKNGNITAIKKKDERSEKVF